MKITSVTFCLLLVLALCNQYAESCLPFYTTYAVMILRNPELLKLDLMKYDPTPEEVNALLKIQECYAEHSVLRTALNIKFMMIIELSPECIKHVMDRVANFKNQLGKM
ncbi:secretoglobin family 2B member 2 [Sminthopsis crassicaudata]|uniref:secretoglobin family 2B member 2 n=1 Tax=Sminthopsis crassicaudata TaxID=9301 RepID=UPI003D68DA19